MWLCECKCFLWENGGRKIGAMRVHYSISMIVMNFNVFYELYDLAGLKIAKFFKIPLNNLNNITH